MARAKYRCRRCKRSFSMAAHLARHNSTIHGSKKKKKTTTKKTGVRRGRPPKKAGVRRGRPKGVTTRFKLRELSLDQLSELILAARQAARQKLAELEADFG